MKKKDYKFKKKKKTYKIRGIISIIVLLIGTMILCVTLGFIQTSSSENKQKNESENVLNEVQNTMIENDKTITKVEYEYNSLNQTTIKTLSEYMLAQNFLEPLADDSDPAKQYALVLEMCASFRNIAQELDIGEIYLIDQTGEVALCSNTTYLGQNLGSSLTKEQMDVVLSYKADGSENGTMSIKGTTVEYHPVIAGGYYTYSTLFINYTDATNSNTTSYFLLMSQSTEILEAELSGINHIGTVLSDVSVGENGFVFAINQETGKFDYFNHDKYDLTDKNATECGYQENAIADKYVGYQTIDGVSYFCVTKEISSKTYGNHLIVVASTSQAELFGNNVVIILFSCVAFILIAGITAGYGMILRRDIANEEIALLGRYKEMYQDEYANGKPKFTEQEINERAEIHLKQTIYKGENKKLRRINIGTRNRKGVQYYYSRHVGAKLLPTMVIGLVVIFVISFFSQTLFCLQGATSTASAKLVEVEAALNNNNQTSSKITEYIGKKYLSKAKLISYILEENPEYVFNYYVEDGKTFALYELDNNGKKVYLKDMYGNPRYSSANTFALTTACQDNGVDSIYIFDEDGHTIATSSEYWYFSLSNNKDDQSYPFNDIIDGKKDSYIQEMGMGEVTNNVEQYIGYVYYYYTYLDTDGTTKYASSNDYTKQLDGKWTKSTITKHRGLMQVSINQSELEHLYEVTTLDYILKSMYVYGEGSTFVAFDNSADHHVVYSPVDYSIGKTAEEIGQAKECFKLDGMYNGFQTVNGVDYYQSIKLIGDYYIASVIPTDSLYSSRVTISLMTLILSFLALLLASSLYSISNDYDDEQYIEAIKKNNLFLERKEAFIVVTPNGKKKKTSSASSRYMKIAWNKKSAEQKLESILIVYLTIASILIFIALMYALLSKNQNSIFTYIFKNEWERGFNIFSITESVMIMIMVITVTKLAQLAVRSFCGTLGARVETTGDLIVSVLKYGGIIGGVFYCLYLFGLNTASLLTSAGILSIVVGLGAQSLIADIIAGVFIVFEGEFRVGDIVTIGDFRGTVLEIGLRTTKIVDATKNIKIFNNSSISGVLNMTKESSFAVADVSIAYGESIERVENILKAEFPKIRKRNERIIDGPFYKGIAQLADSGVIIRVMATCQEKDRVQLSRDLNRELFILFGKNNINIPFPQVTLSYLEDGEKDKVTKAEKASAEQFVEIQQEKSKEIDILDK